MKTSKIARALLLNCLPFSIALLTLLLFAKVASPQTYNAIDWGTYFNDNAHYPDFNYQLDDNVNDIAADNKNPESIYIVGRTNAATQGTFQVCSGGQTIDLKAVNGFLAKYNSCGELIWSTYIGSTVYCLALDVENGKTIIYVGGKAYSGGAFSCDGNATPIFQTDVSDASNGFIAKYEDDDTTVSLLRWTYFGGISSDSSAGTDAVYTMDIYHHHIFLGGDTYSGNLYFGAQYTGDTTYGGNGDGYMAEFDSLLSTLIFFTYIGGSEFDRCHDLKVFQKGNKPINIFIGGSTVSSEGIATGTGFDLTFNGSNDTYLSKWEGNSVNGLFTHTWGTYIGGSGSEHGRKIAVDKNGNVFFTGYTGSTDFPVTTLGYDTLYGDAGNNNTGEDGFVIKVSNKGEKLWCTYIGGNSNEEMGRSLLLFKVGGKRYVIIAGLTKSLSNSFPLVNPIQNLLNGNDTQQYYDVFISILSDVTTTQQQLTFSTYLGGSGEERVGIGQYHPVIALGAHKELYLATVSKSADIQQVVGSEFQNLVHSYNGGSDVFIAKLIDLNNPHEFNCPILRVSNNSFAKDESQQLRIFPNPFQHIFTAEVNSDTDERCLVEVFDGYGKPILRKEFEIKIGANQIPLDLKDRPSGTYFIRIVDSKKVVFSSIIKQ